LSGQADDAVVEGILDEHSRTRDFLDLYAKCQRQLYVFIRGHVPVRSDIDDVFQDTSKILWEKFDQYQAGTDFASWAFAVVRLQLLKYFESQGRLSHLLSPEIASIVAKELVEVSQSADIRVEALRGCIEKLLPSDQLLLKQRYDSAKSVKELADKLRRTESAVYKTLQKIHDSLFDCVRATLSTRSSLT